MQNKYHGKTVSHDVFSPLAKALNKTTIEKPVGQIRFAPPLTVLKNTFSDNDDFKRA